MIHELAEIMKVRSVRRARLLGLGQGCRGIQSWREISRSRRHPESKSAVSKKGSVASLSHWVPKNSTSPEDEQVMQPEDLKGCMQGSQERVDESMRISSRTSFRPRFDLTQNSNSFESSFSFCE